MTYRRCANRPRCHLAPIRLHPVERRANVLRLQRFFVALNDDKEGLPQTQELLAPQGGQRLVLLGQRAQAGQELKLPVHLREARGQLVQGGLRPRSGHGEGHQQPFAWRAARRRTSSDGGAFHLHTPTEPPAAFLSCTRSTSPKSSIARSALVSAFLRNRSRSR